MERVLYPPRPNDWGRMTTCIKHLVRLYHSFESKSSEQRRMYGRFARHLRVAASATIDLKFLTLSFKAMLNIGRDGWLAAADVVSSSTIGGSDLVALLHELRPLEQLFLANQWLLRGDESDPSLRRLMLDLAASGSTQDPTTLLLFFAGLGREHMRIFYPLKALILDSGFEKWMQAQVTLPDHSEKTDKALAWALCVLDVPTLTLSFLLARLDGERIPGEHVWELAERRGGRGHDGLAKAVCRYLGKGTIRVRERAAAVLCRLDWPKSGLVLARLFLKTPSMRKHLAPRLLTLGERDFGFFIKSIAKADQAPLCRYLFSLSCSLAPKFVLSCLDSGYAGTAAKVEVEKLSGALQRLIKEDDERFESYLSQARDRNLPPLSAVKETEPQKQSFLQRILGSREQVVPDVILKDRGPFRNLEISGVSLGGRKLRRSRMEKCIARDCVFKNVVFDEMRVISTDFTRCRMQSVTFDSCRFDYVNFGGVDFSGCRLVNCRFFRCDFTGAVISDYAIQDCSFEECLMDDTVWENGTSKLVEISVSTMHGAIARNVRLEACRFSETSFTFGAWRDVVSLGCEYFECDMAGLKCRACVFRGGSVRGGRIGCRLAGCESDLPDMMGAMLDGFRERAVGLENAAMSEDGEQVFVDETMFDQGNESLKFSASPEGMALARNLLYLWARHWSFGRNEKAMLHNTFQRLEFMAERCEPKQLEFLRLFPLMLCTDVAHEQLGLDDKAPCPLISSYVPSFRELELCRQYFGKTPDHLFHQTHGKVSAIYSIGSLGTLAQTLESDFDCWVCLEEGVRPSKQERAALTTKLRALECYAWDTFGLETHFFLMTSDEVRNNRFGFSDKESSGSAQALLLKDEFYRTALKFAGKSLAWWLMPPAAQPGEYEERVLDSMIYPVVGTPRVADFGSLEHIPPEEFFGACLWQMVKAVKSPFKTVMKFGLLERYARRLDKKVPLLCERIRQVILSGRNGSMFKDAYAALFAEVSRFYVSMGLPNAERLVAEAFMQRIGAAGMQLVLGHASTEIEQVILRDVFKPRGGEPGEQQMPSAWSFRKKRRIGESVNRFILETYSRISSEGVAVQDREVRITVEDLTRLGRQILAVYAPKKGKVGLVPFLGGDNSSLSELLLEGIKAPGKTTRWAVRGRSSQTRSGYFEELFHHTNVYEVLAWLACNGIYTPGMPLRMENTAPLGMDDVVAILNELSEFVPFSGMIASDLDVFLKEEQVAKVFCSVNLTVPRELREAVDVGLIYMTSWGELYTHRVKGGEAASIAADPDQFLKKNLPLPCTLATEYRCYSPRRSQCPRVKFI